MKGYTRLCGGVIRPDGTDFINDLKSVFGGTTFDGAGFNGVMEQLNDTGKWLAQGRWESPEGLIFDLAPANRQGHRITHVFTHTVPGWAGRPPSGHSVFSAARKDLLPLLDTAWKKRGPHDVGDPAAFTIDMNPQIVGTANEKRIKIVVKLDASGNPTNEIITAYPQP